MIAASRAAGLALAFFAAGCASAPGAFPNPAVPVSAADMARATPPVIEGAQFHHVHMNVADRDASIDFYTRHFDAEAARFAGLADAVWTQRSWLLFTEVDEAPAAQEGTTIRHFGWGAPDAPAEFERQQALGAEFVTPIRDISQGLGGAPETFYFMYVRGPDGETIELNTDPDDNFGHLHLASADSVAAAAWYRRMFGVVEMPPYYDDLVIQPGNSATQRQFFDNVLMIINQAGEGTAFSSTRGSVTDHIGVSVPDLDAAMAAVRAHNVPVLAEPREGPDDLFRYAFIEGPDEMAIELIEDHSGHPPITD